MPDVTLYEAQWCQYSAVVRRKLAKAGVEFASVEVPRERDERDELERATGQRGIPVLVVDGVVHAELGDISEAIDRL